MKYVYSGYWSYIDGQHEHRYRNTHALAYHARPHYSDVDLPISYGDWVKNLSASQVMDILHNDACSDKYLESALEMRYWLEVLPPEEGKDWGRAKWVDNPQNDLSLKGHWKGSVRGGGYDFEFNPDKYSSAELIKDITRFTTALDDEFKAWLDLHATGATMIKLWRVTHYDYYYEGIITRGFAKDFARKCPMIRGLDYGPLEWIPDDWDSFIDSRRVQ